MYTWGILGVYWGYFGGILGPLGVYWGYAGVCLGYTGGILGVYSGNTGVYSGYTGGILGLYWGYINWFKSYTFLYIFMFLSSISTLNLLTIASFRIGLPSILFLLKSDYCFELGYLK